MTDSPIGDVITTAQACEILGVNRATISRWVTSGKLKPAFDPPTTSGGRLFYRADIAALADRSATS
jgi:excisionase family DNA binding protein